MISRRRFIQVSVSAALIPALPRVAFSATQIWTRPSWQAFRSDPLYQTFLDTIAQMRANKDATDPLGWKYWGDIHQQLCPHGMPYFLAWHRGLLKRFEMALRHISGNPDMVVPYWDYYTDASLPSEFLDSASPLWRGDRTGDNVQDALTLDPFADTIVNLPRGEDNAYEPSLEAAPHNLVHDLIGGRMGGMLSPLDPIFWVHHSNIDRLWKAWCHTGNGRTMPDPSDPYWVGELEYGPALRTVDRLQTYSTEDLHYVYDNETLPTSLPASASASLRMGTLPIRPASVQTQPLGQNQSLALDESSICVDVPLSGAQQSKVRSLLLQPAARTGASTSAATGPIQLVFDDVKMTGLGHKGGYCYRVYINLPDPGSPSLSQNSYLVGMLGPFEIAAARMRQMRMGAHPNRNPNAPLQITMPITEALRRIWPDSLDKLSVSFIRASGTANPAKGPVIRVSQFRVEAGVS